MNIVPYIGSPTMNSKLLLIRICFLLREKSVSFFVYEALGNISSPRASNVFDSSLITSERPFWGRVVHRSTEIVSFSIFGVPVRVFIRESCLLYIESYRKEYNKYIVY